MANSDELPVMLPFPDKEGAGWHVIIRYHQGHERRVDGFATEAEATEWIVANSAERYGFTSQEIARRSDGSFEIVLSARARPGNWLPTGGIDRYLIVMRLYDTPVGVASRTAKDAPMPAVQETGCT